MSLVLENILSCASAAAPGRVAITLEDESLTFGQVHARSNRIANVLTALGVGRGDRVAYWSDLSLDAIALKFGVARVGAAFAPLNPAYSQEEARAVLEYLVPRILVVDAAHAERVEPLVSDLDLALVTTGGARSGACLDALEAAASARTPDVPLPDEDDVVTIFLTSGSTGKPKGAMVTHRATWLRVFAGCGPLTSTSGRGQLVMFPLFHMAGWIFVLNAWSAHQPAHLVPRAHAPVLLSALERHSASSLYCIPAVWQRILDEKHPYRLDSLEWALIGTSKIDVDLLRAIRERFPLARTTVSYGSTEVGRALSLPHPDLFRKVESVGLPVPGVQATVADDGELLVFSDTLMSGYYNLPDETTNAFVDGWYRTGDIVERDDEGYYTIVGRKREIIRSGGEWVAPVEVEAALADYPGIADLAVVGVADDRWGEVVCAAVVIREGARPPTVENLHRYLDGRLASYKHPRRVMVVDELPRTSVTGQVKRAAVARHVEMP